MKKPEVWMIRIKDNMISNHYKEKCKYSWQRQGYKVRYYDAITPETIPKTPSLYFNDPIRFKIKKRFFSETEMAVWFSHFLLWKFCSDKLTPIIICEHDALLYKPIPEKIFNSPIAGLCYASVFTDKRVKKPRKTAGGAYLLSPKIATYMYDIHSNPNTHDIVHNVDAIIEKFIDSYGQWENCVTQFYSSKIGTTIDHGKPNISGKGR